jgi:hypothetical protein
MCMVVDSPGHLALWSTPVPFPVALLVVVASTAPTRLADSPAAAMPLILIELVLAALRQPTPDILPRSMLLRLVQPIMVLLAVHRHRHGAPPSRWLVVVVTREPGGAAGALLVPGGAILSPTAALISPL